MQVHIGSCVVCMMYIVYTVNHFWPFVIIQIETSVGRVKTASVAKKGNKLFEKQPPEPDKGTPHSPLLETHQDQLSQCLPSRKLLHWGWIPDDLRQGCQGAQAVGWRCPGGRDAWQSPWNHWQELHLAKLMRKTRGASWPLAKDKVTRPAW